MYRNRIRTREFEVMFKWDQLMSDELMQDWECLLSCESSQLCFADFLEALPDYPLIWLQIIFCRRPFTRQRTSDWLRTRPAFYIPAFGQPMILSNSNRAMFRYELIIKVPLWNGRPIILLSGRGNIIYRPIWCKFNFILSETFILISSWAKSFILICTCFEPSRILLSRLYCRASTPGGTSEVRTLTLPDTFYQYCLQFTIPDPYLILSISPLLRASAHGDG